MDGTIEPIIEAVEQFLGARNAFDVKVEWIERSPNFWTLTDNEQAREKRTLTVAEGRALLLAKGAVAEALNTYIDERIHRHYIDNLPPYDGT